MKRLGSTATLPTNLRIPRLRIACLVSVATLLLTLAPPLAHAITISIEHTPEDENPSWDPDGSILTAHFQAAVAIWEDLLPGPMNFEFDYHWDNDIDGLGMATPLGIDDFIEINSTREWFADPTPNDNVEFTFAPTSENGGPVLPHQQLFRDLSSTDRVNNFPGEASPPDTLETMYRGFGSSAFPSLQPGFNATTGNDLLRTVVHEIGHLLGINGLEPGDYNISPAHIGGFEDVLVGDGDGGHLSGNNNAPGFLMCNECGVRGRRVLPSATDVLVIAEDQGIEDVHLARVDRITPGAWNNANAWIGGDIPDDSQEVFVRHGSSLVLDVDAEIKSLTIANGSSLSTTDRELVAAGTIDFGTNSLTASPGGTIAANNLVGDPANFTSVAGSLVRFNSFTRGTSTATTVTFNGSVAISRDVDSIDSVAFNPNPILDWNIGEDLTIGDENDMHVDIASNGSDWIVGGNLTVGPSGGSTHWRGRLTLAAGANMTVDGNVTVRGTGAISEVTIQNAASVDIDGTVTLEKYSRMTYQNGLVENETFNIKGGTTSVLNTGPPSNTYYFKRDAGGELVFQTESQVRYANISVEGGTGNEGPPGQVTFTGSSAAINGTLQTRGGRRGPDLPFGSEIAGLGGQITFTNSSLTGNINPGTKVDITNFGSEYRGGTGGTTTFTGQSKANEARIVNHGGTFTNGSVGGAVHFDGTATASNAEITNHGSVAIDGGGNATFFGSSNGGHAIISNEASTPSQFRAGFTVFRGNSVASGTPIFVGDPPVAIYSMIYNRGTTAGSNYPGLTSFYDFASAGNATIRNNPGYSYGGRTEFRGSSNGGDAKIFIEKRLPSTRGGSINFYDNASAGSAKITAETDSFSDGINFNDGSTAGNAEITLVDDSVTFVRLFGQSKGGTAQVDVGRINQLQLIGRSDAQSMHVTLQPGGGLSTSGDFNAEDLPTSTLGNAQIHVLGANTGTYNFGGSVGVGRWSTAGDATITVEGSTGAYLGGSPWGSVSFDHSGHAGNATINLKSGVNGGRGAELYFQRGGNGDNARIVTESDTKVFVRNFGILEATSAGSIEGGGRFHIAGGGLFIVGSRNDNTLVTGPIVNEGLNTMGEGGALTKVGSGTLTLAGANTYTGDTNVDAGTLVVNGSMTSEIIVKGGAALMGSGSIAGDVTVNSGATLAPGTSPGTLTLHNLTLAGGSTLNYELGDPLRDLIVVTGGGNVSLAGTLNIALLPGFTPSLGQSFALFEGAIGAITGAFSSVNVPTINGLTFNLVQNASSFMLQVASAPFLAGDYNGNGTVDAADYVMWRKNLGSNTSLLNDDTPGVSQDDYTRWRTHFGQTSNGISSILESAVPEPRSGLLLAIAIVAGFVSGCPRHCNRPRIFRA